MDESESKLREMGREWLGQFGEEVTDERLDAWVEGAKRDMASAGVVAGLPQRQATRAQLRKLQAAAVEAGFNSTGDADLVAGMDPQMIALGIARVLHQHADTELAAPHLRVEWFFTAPGQPMTEPTTMLLDVAEADFTALPEVD